MFTWTYIDIIRYNHFHRNIIWDYLGKFVILYTISKSHCTMQQNTGNPKKGVILFLPVNLQELRQAFRMFDKNKDGMIDSSELKWMTTTMGQRLTQEELEAFMREADLDGDGKLNYEEFCRMMTSI